MEPNITLDATVLLNVVTEKMMKYEDYNLLEQYAIFMMKCQLLEMVLKSDLEERVGLKSEETEKFTLGTTITRMEQADLRPDYVSLLRELLAFRNEFAHDFLIDNLLGNEMVGENFDALSSKRMRYALYKINETTIVYEFLNGNNLLFVDNN